MSKVSFCLSILFVLTVSQFGLLQLNASSIQQQRRRNESREKCLNNEFECDDGQCVNLIDVCVHNHFHVFCEDGTDMTGACSNVTCPLNYVKCQSDGLCIPQHLVCDSQPHCTDGTDELDSVCLTSTEPLYCSRGEEKCPGLHMCIVRSHFCDGENDCVIDSDENAQFCSERTCLPNEVRCDNGQCIDRQQFCRQRTMSSCVDNSLDPRSSDVCNVVCHVRKAKCPGTNQCIRRHHFCDGEDDCDDGSDEDDEFCREGRVCESNEILCNNGQCLDRKSFCDGRHSCYDGSLSRENVLTCPR